MFSCRIYDQGSDKLLAVCDYGIMEKTFSSGGIEIEVGEFYKGEKCDAKKALDLAKRSTIINAIGNEIVGLLIKNKLVDKESVLEIGGVLHAQVVAIE
ncbi:MAG: DUF424 family protein [Candidatus Aenigmarchaeota archaeon]|nr:DUF424 family protein [Candidatus Aenigmarchaeota archaeon]